MRKFVALVAVLLCGAGAATAYAATRTVKVGDDWYVAKGSPRTITVKKGTKLKFRWVGSSPHNVYTMRGPSRVQSPTKRSGTWTSRKLRRGTYVLYCSIHGPNLQSVTVKVK